MEEGVLCLALRLAHQLLYVVHDEHVYALIEVHEVVERVEASRVGKLYFKEVGAQVEDAFLGVQFFHALSDGVHQMCLAHAAGAVDKEGVEGLLVGILCNGLTDAAWQLVAVAFDKVLEVLLRVKL